MKEKDDRAFVYHLVKDVETGEILAAGMRYKDISDLVYEGSSRFLWRWLDHYYRYAVICGRTCKVIYCSVPPYHNWKRTDRLSCVTQEGKEHGLRGGLFGTDELFKAGEKLIRANSRQRFKELIKSYLKLFVRPWRKGEKA